ncbi:MAG TPA: SDR family NAD(P)-dependent oxidoreductase [Steroidobacteraceae bacterium]|nr:SDR family NAD(P)-dependent oxidoreductase [Steroidobacteraceae bacterium]
MDDKTEVDVTERGAATVVVTEARRRSRGRPRPRSAARCRRCDAVSAAADRIVAEWGTIDVWVNDAMAPIFSPVHEIKPDEFRRVTEVTYLCQVYGNMAALKHMRPRNHGTIVQVVRR